MLYWQRRLTRPARGVAHARHCAVWSLPLTGAAGHGHAGGPDAAGRRPGGSSRCAHRGTGAGDRPHDAECRDTLAVRAAEADRAPPRSTPAPTPKPWAVPIVGEPREAIVRAVAAGTTDPLPLFLATAGLAGVALAGGGFAIAVGRELEAL